MALQKSMITLQGVTASDAYIKIESFHGDKNIVRVDVQVFFNGNNEKVLAIFRNAPDSLRFEK